MTRQRSLKVSLCVPVPDPVPCSPPLFRSSRYHGAMLLTRPVATRFYLANKRELVDDLIVKAKQIEVLIQSLPVPEPEETQASLGSSFPFPPYNALPLATRVAFRFRAGTPPRSVGNRHDRGERGVSPGGRSRESVNSLSFMTRSPVSLKSFFRSLSPLPALIAERLHCQYSELLRMLLDNADVSVDLSPKAI